jgi:hypothetical protein
MNARERLLLIALVGIVGGGLFLLGTWFWFVAPLKEYNTKIANLKKRNEELDQTMIQFLLDKKKLNLARTKSLPANPAEATSEYLAYLHPLLAKSGLTVDDVSPSQTAKMRFQPTVAGIKEVGHQTMTFTVRARGDLKQLVGAMERIQATPYEHRIKTLTVDRADLRRDAAEANPKLLINMVLEVLLVAKTETKTGLPPGVDSKYLILDSIAAQSGAPAGWGLLGSTVALRQSMPAPEERDYDTIAMRNPFAGPVPEIRIVKEFENPKKVKDVVKEEDPGPPAPKEFVPRYVYLTQTDPDAQVAYWYNRIYRGLEQKIETNRPGYQTFKITGEDGAYVYFTGKVLRVDPGVVYFQKKSEKWIYAWQIGGNLEQAMQQELDFDARDRLDLLPDAEWAKADDTTKKKTTTPTKKTGTKGGGKSE